MSAEAFPHSPQVSLLHGGCSQCDIRKRNGPCWRPCLLIYSMPSPTMHFSLQIMIFDYKNTTRVYGGSFIWLFFFSPPQRNTWDRLSSITTAAFLHGIWWIFLSLEDSSSCGFKKNTKYCETNNKSTRPGSAASPLWAISIPSSSPLNHTMQGPLLVW